MAGRGSRCLGCSATARPDSTPSRPTNLNSIAFIASRGRGGLGACSSWKFDVCVDLLAEGTKKMKDNKLAQLIAAFLTQYPLAFSASAGSSHSGLPIALW